MSYDAPTLRRDLAGGIASALVVLPLALAFGVVSGLGAAAVGFFAAVFGGTKVQVSGATAPMALAMSFVVARRLPDRTPAQAEPGAGRRGSGQHRGRTLRGPARSGRARGHGGQHPPRGLPATSLQSLDALRRVPGDHFVESLDDARAIAERLLDR